MATNTNRNGRISIVIPLYNHERYIAQAVDSACAQSAKPLEVIVVDDGSHDNSAELVREFMHHRPEVVFWSHPNQGAHYTINAGVYRAQGEFVAILNSDDTYHSERLAECLEVFDADPGVAAVTTAFSFMDDRGKAIRNPWYDQARAFYDQVGDLSLALVNGNFFMTTSNLIIRRSLFREVGFFSALRYAHDLDFFLRLLLREKRIHFLDKPLLSYRLHATNTIREDALKVKMEWAAVVAFFIYNRWRRPRRERDWDYYGRLTEITDRHGLTRLLVHFFAFFGSLPPGELTCDAFTRDESFRRFLAEVVR